MTPEQQDLYEEGRLYFQQGKLNKAESCFLEIVKDSPQRFPDVYNKLGVIAYQKDLLDKAALYFEKALSINPAYTEAALNLSIVYNDLGRYDEARSLFERLFKSTYPSSRTKDLFIEGRLANEHARLGDQYYDLGRYKEAIGEYKKALRLCPRFVDILLRLAITLRDYGDLENAVRTLLKAIRINPSYPPVYVHLGIIYYMKGFVDMAIQEWRKAIEIDPENKNARIYLTFASKAES